MYLPICKQRVWTCHGLSLQWTKKLTYTNSMCNEKSGCSSITWVFNYKQTHQLCVTKWIRHPLFISFVKQPVIKTRHRWYETCKLQISLFTSHWWAMLLRGNNKTSGPIWIVSMTMLRDRKAWQGSKKNSKSNLQKNIKKNH
jgi:hypothetical protein